VAALTVTVPAPWAWENTRICVVLKTVTVPGGTEIPPKATVVAPETKPVPVNVTIVPPATDPVLGVTLVTVGGGMTYVKCSPAPEVPAMVVAVTVTVPALWAGDVTLTWVVLMNVTAPVGMVVPPNVTVVAPETNPVPVRVTVVPPVVSPEFGVTLEIVGGGT
jgi:hypothetical protein